MRGSIAIATLGLLFGVSGASAAQVPSFSCAHPHAADERAICRSPTLIAQDRRMTELYHTIAGCSAMGSHGVLIEEQRDWLKRRAACGGNSTCIGKLYRARIAQFAPQAAEARKFMAQDSCPGL